MIKENKALFWVLSGVACLTVPVTLLCVIKSFCCKSKKLTETTSKKKRRKKKSSKMHMCSTSENIPLLIRSDNTVELSSEDNKADDFVENFTESTYTDINESADITKHISFPQIETHESLKSIYSSVLSGKYHTRKNLKEQYGETELKTKNIYVSNGDSTKPLEVSSLENFEQLSYVNLKLGEKLQLINNVGKAKNDEIPKTKNRMLKKTVENISDKTDHRSTADNKSFDFSSLNNVDALNFKPGTADKLRIIKNCGKISRKFNQRTNDKLSQIMASEKDTVDTDQVLCDQSFDDAVLDIESKRSENIQSALKDTVLNIEDSTLETDCIELVKLGKILSSVMVSDSRSNDTALCQREHNKNLPEMSSKSIQFNFCPDLNSVGSQTKAPKLFLNKAVDKKCSQIPEDEPIATDNVHRLRSNDIIIDVLDSDRSSVGSTCSETSQSTCIIDYQDETTDLASTIPDHFKLKISLSIGDETSINSTTLSDDIYSNKVVDKLIPVSRSYSVANPVHSISFLKRHANAYTNPDLSNNDIEFKKDNGLALYVPNHHDTMELIQPEQSTSEIYLNIRTTEHTYPPIVNIKSRTTSLTNLSDNSNNNIVDDSEIMPPSRSYYVDNTVYSISFLKEHANADMNSTSKNKTSGFEKVIKELKALENVVSETQSVSVTDEYFGETSRSECSFSMSDIETTEQSSTIPVSLKSTTSEYRDYETSTNIPSLSDSEPSLLTGIEDFYLSSYSVDDPVQSTSFLERYANVDKKSTISKNSILNVNEWEINQESTFKENPNYYYMSHSRKRKQCQHTENCFVDKSCNQHTILESTIHKRKSAVRKSRAENDTSFFRTDVQTNYLIDAKCGKAINNEHGYEIKSTSQLITDKNNTQTANFIVHQSNTGNMKYDELNDDLLEGKITKIIKDLSVKKNDTHLRKKRFTPVNVLDVFDKRSKTSDYENDTQTDDLDSGFATYSTKYCSETASHSFNTVKAGILPQSKSRNVSDTSSESSNEMPAYTDNYSANKIIPYNLSQSSNKNTFSNDKLVKMYLKNNHEPQQDTQSICTFSEHSDFSSNISHSEIKETSSNMAMLVQSSSPKNARLDTVYQPADSTNAKSNTSSSSELSPHKVVSQSKELLYPSDQQILAVQKTFHFHQADQSLKEKESEDTLQHRRPTYCSNLSYTGYDSKLTSDRGRRKQNDKSQRSPQFLSDYEIRAVKDEFGKLDNGQTLPGEVINRLKSTAEINCIHNKDNIVDDVAHISSDVESLSDEKKEYFKTPKCRQSSHIDTLRYSSNLENDYIHSNQKFSNDDVCPQLEPLVQPEDRQLAEVQLESKAHESEISKYSYIFRDDTSESKRPCDQKSRAVKKSNDKFGIGHRYDKPYKNSSDGSKLYKDQEPIGEMFNKPSETSNNDSNCKHNIVKTDNVTSCFTSYVESLSDEKEQYIKNPKCRQSSHFDTSSYSSDLESEYIHNDQKCSNQDVRPQLEPLAQPEDRQLAEVQLENKAHESETSKYSCIFGDDTAESKKAHDQKSRADKKSNDKFGIDHRYYKSYKNSSDGSQLYKKQKPIGEMFNKPSDTSNNDSNCKHDIVKTVNVTSCFTSDVESLLDEKDQCIETPKCQQFSHFDTSSYSSDLESEYIHNDQKCSNQDDRPQLEPEYIQLAEEQLKTKANESDTSTYSSIFRDNTAESKKESLSDEKVQSIEIPNCRQSSHIDTSSYSSDLENDYMHIDQKCPNHDVHPQLEPSAQPEYKQIAEVQLESKTRENDTSKYSLNILGDDTAESKRPRDQKGGDFKKSIDKIDNGHGYFKSYKNSSDGSKLYKEQGHIGEMLNKPSETSHNESNCLHHIIKTVDVTSCFMSDVESLSDEKEQCIETPKYRQSSHSDTSSCSSDLEYSIKIDQHCSNQNSLPQLKTLEVIPLPKHNHLVEVKFEIKCQANDDIGVQNIEIPKFQNSIHSSDVKNGIHMDLNCSNLAVHSPLETSETQSENKQYVEIQSESSAHANFCNPDKVESKKSCDIKRSEHPLFTEKGMLYNKRFQRNHTMQCVTKSKSTPLPLTESCLFAYETYCNISDKAMVNKNLYDDLWNTEHSNNGHFELENEQEPQNKGSNNTIISNLEDTPIAYNDNPLIIRQSNKAHTSTNKIVQVEELNNLHVDTNKSDFGTKSTHDSKNKLLSSDHDFKKHNFVMEKLKMARKSKPAKIKNLFRQNIHGENHESHVTKKHSYTRNNMAHRVEDIIDDSDPNTSVESSATFDDGKLLSYFEPKEVDNFAIEDAAIGKTFIDSSDGSIDVIENRINDALIDPIYGESVKLQDRKEDNGFEFIKPRVIERVYKLYGSRASKKILNDILLDQNLSDTDFEQTHGISKSDFFQEQLLDLSFVSNSIRTEDKSRHYSPDDSNFLLNDLICREDSCHVKLQDEYSIPNITVSAHENEVIKAIEKTGSTKHKDLVPSLVNSNLDAECDINTAEEKITETSSTKSSYPQILHIMTSSSIASNKHVSQSEKNDSSSSIQDINSTSCISQKSLYELLRFKKHSKFEFNEKILADLVDPNLSDKDFERMYVFSRPSIFKEYQYYRFKNDVNRHKTLKKFHPFGNISPEIFLDDVSSDTLYDVQNHSKTLSLKHVPDAQNETRANYLQPNSHAVSDTIKRISVSNENASSNDVLFRSPFSTNKDDFLNSACDQTKENSDILVTESDYSQGTFEKLLLDSGNVLHSKWHNKGSICGFNEKIIADLDDPKLSDKYFIKKKSFPKGSILKDYKFYRLTNNCDKQNTVHEQTVEDFSITSDVAERHMALENSLNHLYSIMDKREDVINSLYEKFIACEEKEIAVMHHVQRKVYELEMTYNSSSGSVNKLHKPRRSVTFHLPELCQENLNLKTTPSLLGLDSYLTDVADIAESLQSNSDSDVYIHYNDNIPYDDMSRHMKDDYQTSEISNDFGNKSLLKICAHNFDSTQPFFASKIIKDDFIKNSEIELSDYEISENDSESSSAMTSECSYNINSPLLLDANDSFSSNITLMTTAISQTRLDEKYRSMTDQTQVVPESLGQGVIVKSQSDSCCFGIERHSDVGDTEVISRNKHKHIPKVRFADASLQCCGYEFYDIADRTKNGYLDMEHLREYLAHHANDEIIRQIEVEVPPRKENFLIIRDKLSDLFRDTDGHSINEYPRVAVGYLSENNSANITSVVSSSESCQFSTNKLYDVSKKVHPDVNNLRQYLADRANNEVICKTDVDLLLNSHSSQFISSSATSADIEHDNNRGNFSKLNVLCSSNSYSQVSRAPDGHCVDEDSLVATNSSDNSSQNFLENSLTNVPYQCDDPELNICEVKSKDTFDIKHLRQYLADHGNDTVARHIDMEVPTNMDDFQIIKNKLSSIFREACSSISSLKEKPKPKTVNRDTGELQNIASFCKKLSATSTNSQFDNAKKVLNALFSDNPKHMKHLEDDVAVTCISDFVSSMANSADIDPDACHRSSLTPARSYNHPSVIRELGDYHPPEEYTSDDVVHNIPEIQYTDDSEYEVNVLANESKNIPLDMKHLRQYLVDHANDEIIRQIDKEVPPNAIGFQAIRNKLSGLFQEASRSMSSLKEKPQPKSINRHTGELQNISSFCRQLSDASTNSQLQFQNAKKVLLALFGDDSNIMKTLENEDVVSCISEFVNSMANLTDQEDNSHHRNMSTPTLLSVRHGVHDNSASEFSESTISSDEWLSHSSSKSISKLELQQTSISTIENNELSTGILESGAVFSDEHVGITKENLETYSTVDKTPKEQYDKSKESNDGTKVYSSDTQSSSSVKTQIEPEPTNETYENERTSSKVPYINELVELLDTTAKNKQQVAESSINHVPEDTVVNDEENTLNEWYTDSLSPRSNISVKNRLKNKFLRKARSPSKRKREVNVKKYKTMDLVLDTNITNNGYAPESVYQSGSGIEENQINQEIKPFTQPRKRFPRFTKLKKSLSPKVNRLESPQEKSPPKHIIQFLEFPIKD